MSTLGRIGTRIGRPTLSRVHRRQRPFDGSRHASAAYGCFLIAGLTSLVGCVAATQPGAEAAATMQSGTAALVLEPITTHALLQVASQRERVVGASRAGEVSLVRSHNGHQFEVETDVGATTEIGLRGFLESAALVKLGETPYNAIFPNALGRKGGESLTVSSTIHGGKIEAFRTEVLWYHSLFQTLRAKGGLQIPETDLAVVDSHLNSFQYPDARVLLALRPGSPESYAAYTKQQNSRVRVPFIPLPSPVNAAGVVDWGAFADALQGHLDAAYGAFEYAKYPEVTVAGDATSRKPTQVRRGIDVVAIDLTRVFETEAEVRAPVEKRILARANPLDDLPVLFLTVPISPGTGRQAHAKNISNADRSSMVRLFKLTPR